MDKVANRRRVDIMEIKKKNVTKIPRFTSLNTNNKRVTKCNTNRNSTSEAKRYYNPYKQNVTMTDSFDGKRKENVTNKDDQHKAQSQERQHSKQKKSEFKSSQITKQPEQVINRSKRYTQPTETTRYEHKKMGTSTMRKERGNNQNGKHNVSNMTKKNNTMENKRDSNKKRHSKPINMSARTAKPDGINHRQHNEPMKNPQCHHDIYRRRPTTENSRGINISAMTTNRNDNTQSQHNEATLKTGHGRNMNPNSSKKRHKKEMGISAMATKSPDSRKKREKETKHENKKDENSESHHSERHHRRMNKQSQTTTVQSKIGHKPHKQNCKSTKSNHKSKQDNSNGSPSSNGNQAHNNIHRSDESQSSKKDTIWQKYSLQFDKLVAKTQSKITQRASNKIKVSTKNKIHKTTEMDVENQKERKMNKYPQDNHKKSTGSNPKDEMEVDEIEFGYNDNGKSHSHKSPNSNSDNGNGPQFQNAIDLQNTDVKMKGCNDSTDLTTSENTDVHMKDDNITNNWNNVQSPFNPNECQVTTVYPDGTPASCHQTRPYDVGSKYTMTPHSSAITHRKTQKIGINQQTPDNISTTPNNKRSMDDERQQTNTNSLNHNRSSTTTHPPKHRKKNAKSTTRKFSVTGKCRHCGKEYKYDRRRADHELYCHKNKDRIERPERNITHQGRDFSGPVTQEKSIIYYENGVAVKWTCRKCLKISYKSNPHYNHTRTCQSKPIHCRYCDRVFKRSDYLKDHMRKSHPDRMRP